jgi:hypothetical protein
VAATRRPPCPGAPDSAPSYEAEVGPAVEFERSLPSRGLLPASLVVLVVAIRVVIAR